MGHVCITYAEVIKQYYVTCEIVGNTLETCLKCGKFVGSNSSLKKSTEIIGYS